jgi:peptide/nickel transport system permease protein
MEDSGERSVLFLVLRKMWHLRMGVLGASILCILVSTALFSSYMAPHDPYKQNIVKRLLPPAWMEKGVSGHILGTDHLGRDLLSRIMYGSRISLVVGVSSVVLQIFLGVTMGLLAGYYGGRTDSVISFVGSRGQVCY